MWMRWRTFGRDWFWGTELSWVCFAHTNGHPDKFNTLPSLISICSNSAYSSKTNLNSPSSSKPFLTPHALHLALKCYICLSCHNYPCHLCLIRVNVGNLFVQPDHIWDTLGQNLCQTRLSLRPKHRIRYVIPNKHLSISHWINLDKLNGYGMRVFGILAKFLVLKQLRILDLSKDNYKESRWNIST